MGMLVRKDFWTICRGSSRTWDWLQHCSTRWTSWMKGRGNQTQLLFSEHLGEISHCYNIGYADHRWPFHPILGIAGHNQWGFNGHNHPLLWLAHWPRAPAMKCHVDLGQTGLGASRDIGFLFHRTSFDRKRESGGRVLHRTFEHTAQFSPLQCRKVQT